MNEQNQREKITSIHREKEKNRVEDIARLVDWCANANENECDVKMMQSEVCEVRMM